MGKFSRADNLDIPAIVSRLNLNPIRIKAGRFVTYLQDQKYVLDKTDAGIRLAIRFKAPERKSAPGDPRYHERKLYDKANH